MSREQQKCPPPKELFALVDAFFENAKYLQEHGRYLFTLSSGRPSKGAVYELLGPHRQFSAEKAHWKVHRHRPRNPSLQIKFTDKLLRFFRGARIAGVISEGLEASYVALRQSWAETYGDPPRGDLGELIKQLESYQCVLRVAIASEGKEASRKRIRDASAVLSHFPSARDIATNPAGIAIPATFVGRRAERDALLEQISRDRRIIIVEGVPGVGKSSIAAQSIADIVRMTQYERVVSMSARGGSLNEDAFLDQICTSFKYPSITQLDTASKRKATKEIIADKICVLFIDNFETCLLAEQEKILTFLADLDKAVALITSRSFPELCQSLSDQIFYLKLKGLNVNETRALIRSEAERLSMSLDCSDLVDETLELYNITGGNPLAIKFVMARLRRSTQSFPELLSDFKSAKADFFEEVFSRSWADLTPRAKVVLTAAALFPAPFTEEGVAAASGLSDALARSSLEELIGYSFVDRSSGVFANGARFQTHPLVAAFARNRADRQQWLQSVLRLGNYFENASDSDDLVFWEGRKNYDNIEYDFLNIIHVANELWEERQNLEFAMLIRSVADFLYARGHWGTCLDVGSQGAIAAERAGDPGLESWIRVHMTGYLYASRSDLVSAIHEFRKAADLAVRVGNVVYESIALRNLGRALRKSGYVMEALHAYRRSRQLAGSEELRRELALTLNELGKLARDIGSFRRALCYFDLALDRLAGAENSIAAGILCNIGGVAISLGDLELAKSASDRSHEYFLGVGNREGLASSKWRLAIIAKILGEESSHTYAAEAAKIFEKLGMGREVALIQDEFGIHEWGN
jgi:tetratricopeptide (TPR) repeat protein